MTEAHDEPDEVEVERDVDRQGRAPQPAARGPVVRFEEQVGLALRAYRRSERLSQRALAEVLGLTQSTVARLERSAGHASLTTVVQALAATGHDLGVLDGEGRVVTWWEPTDLVARDRADRRFPATRRVRPVRPGGFGPWWWEASEFLGTGRCGPQPAWTAEGFQIPDGTRFGRRARPYAPDEGPRWPGAPADLRRPPPEDP